jgi:hypothetical protein
MSQKRLVSLAEHQRLLAQRDETIRLLRQKLDALIQSQADADRSPKAVDKPGAAWRALLDRAKDLGTRTKNEAGHLFGLRIRTKLERQIEEAEFRWFRLVVDYQVLLEETIFEAENRTDGRVQEHRLKLKIRWFYAVQALRADLKSDRAVAREVVKELPEETVSSVIHAVGRKNDEPHGELIRQAEDIVASGRIVGLETDENGHPCLQCEIQTSGNVVEVLPDDPLVEVLLRRLEEANKEKDGGPQLSGKAYRLMLDVWRKRATNS